MIGDSKNPGLYLLAAQDIFRYLRDAKNSSKSVYVSYFEIYCGKLFDLLNNRQKLQAREDAKQNINVVGLKRFQIQDEKSLFEMINFGNSVRVTSTTGKNMDSSRSHAILQIYVVENNAMKGLLSFIDLAGNERGADTYEHDSQTRLDGAEISKSLLALKECIRALDQDKKHVPFRGSKLTMVLKDSFIGDCKTVMIGNISPSTINCEYSLNTLRYADRVKELKKDVKDREKMGGNKELFLPRHGENVNRYDVKPENPNAPIITPYISNPYEGNRGDKHPNTGSEKPNMNVPTAYVNPFPMKEKPLTPQLERKPSDGSFSSNSNNPFAKRKHSNSKKNLRNDFQNQQQHPGSLDNEFGFLTTQHEDLINQILEEEELLLKKHCAHIKLMSNLTAIVL